MNRYLPAVTPAVTPAIAALLLPALALFPQASRAGNEVYGGLGIGYSTFEIDELDFEAAEFAVRQFLGLGIGDHFGIEAGFVNFGTVDDRVIDQFGQPSVEYTVDTWGYNLTLVGSYPLNSELSAFGKVGMVRWDSEARLKTFPLATKQDGDDLVWGAGLDYRGTDRVRVRVDIEFVDIEFADGWWVLTTSLLYGIPFDW